MLTNLINKDAVVAEIERIKKEECPTDSYEGRCKLLWFEQFLSFINSLEVKEVDLEKEIQDHIKECLDVKFPTTDVELIKKDVAYTAKKFFELGLRIGM